MVSILLLIFNFPTLFHRPIRAVLRFPTTTSCSSFSALEQDPSICLSFRFLLFLFSCLSERLNPQDGKFSFLFLFVLRVSLFLFVLDVFFWSGFVGSFVSQNPREFYSFHFLGSNMIRYLAQFPMDHLFYPFMPSLGLFLSYFASLNYYVINRLICIST